MPDRSDEELQEVLKALSLHGSEGRVELRDQIVSAYGKLLRVHPQMSGWAAADLLAWNRTQWTQELAEIAEGSAPLDDAARQVIRQYLRRASVLDKGQLDR